MTILIEKKIICMHGGIGRSIYHVEKIENIITMDAGSIVLMDLLWSVHVFCMFVMFLVQSLTSLLIWKRQC